MRRALVLLCATAVLGYNLPQIAPCHIQAATNRHAPITAAATDEPRLMYCDALSKSYDGKRYQFRDISLGVAAGSRIGLIGASRGQSSYYLSLFPQWESVSVPPVSDVSASQIRDALFRGPASAQAHLAR